MENDAGSERPDPPHGSANAESGRKRGFPPSASRAATQVAATVDVGFPEVREGEFPGGRYAVFTCRSPKKDKESDNEDAVAAIPLPPEQGLLLVADGLGGHRGGRRASQLLKSSLTKRVVELSRSVPPPLLMSGVVPVPIPPDPARSDLRGAVLEAIEKVNKRLLRGGLGGATTLALAELDRHRVRSYHAGDSELLVVNRRGSVRYSTVSHSPIGYAFESGLLTEEEALLHPQRHIVSNVVGSPMMSIEIGPWVPLTAQDTVLLASDGLFDNLMQSEVAEIVRKGPLGDAVRELAETAYQRMLSPMQDFPSKPDDLTILAYRITAGKRSRKRTAGERTAPR